MRVLITVKAAPNPSEQYGETVCVAGLRLDPDQGGWVRLYPVNFRELDSESRFRKYDVVSVVAVPNFRDPRAESWRPQIGTLAVERHLPPWRPRQVHIDDYVTGSMCELIAAARQSAAARSLAAIRPRRVLGLDIEPHGSWTAEEQRKISRYMDQLELPGLASRVPRTALEAPRFRGWYRYLCQAAGCRQHRQGIYDWEWTAFQRRLPADDERARESLTRRFLDEICAPGKDLVFFTGNQQKRPQGFMILGMFYPPRAH